MVGDTSPSSRQFAEEMRQKYESIKVDRFLSCNLEILKALTEEQLSFALIPFAVLFMLVSFSRSLRGKVTKILLLKSSVISVLKGMKAKCYYTWIISHSICLCTWKMSLKTLFWFKNGFITPKLIINQFY